MVCPINLSRVEAVHQVVGLDVYKLDGGCLVENAVGNAFEYGHMRDARHFVVEAFDVLHVDRRIHVDAGTQQFFDILVALAMAACVGVRMGKLVYQHDLRMAGERGVEVELAQRNALVLDRQRRDLLKPLQQRRRGRSLVGLDIPCHHVEALTLGLVRRFEHRVCLAHPCGISEEYLETAHRGACGFLVLLYAAQEVVGVLPRRFEVHQSAFLSRRKNAHIASGKGARPSPETQCRGRKRRGLCAICIPGVSPTRHPA